MDPDRSVIMDGGLITAGGRITALGPWREVRGRGPYRDLGQVTLVPGLINAHVHLGFVHLAGRIPAGLGFMAWADRLFACRGEKIDIEALVRAVVQMREHGVVCVGDVVGRDAELVREVLNAQEVDGHLFREWAGSGRAPEPRPLPGRWSLAVHALYSCRAEQARRVKAWCIKRGLPFSLHLAEVPGENELFLQGTGSFADFVTARRLLPKSFTPPGLRAVPFAHSLGLLDQHTLAVHCVHVHEGDAEILAQSGASICLCPRSNAWIGVGQAPATMLYAAGIPLCVGTDSPASVADLNLWADLRAVRDMLPDASLHDLLTMVTRNPARILGLATEFGCLRTGMRAAWAVLPEDFAEML